MFVRAGKGPGVVSGITSCVCPTPSPLCLLPFSSCSFIRPCVLTVTPQAPPTPLPAPTPEPTGHAQRWVPCISHFFLFFYFCSKLSGGRWWGSWGGGGGPPGWGLGAGLLL